MSHHRFFTVFLSAFTLVFAQMGAVQAQSAIERSLVAKSKLHNKIWKKSNSGSTLKVDHSSWTEFLSKYVEQDQQGINKVAYGRVAAKDRKALATYLAQLQAIDVTTLNRNEQFAFWVNLYNASVVMVVLDKWPIKSILDVKTNVLDLKGPFNDVVAVVNGLELTPDTIESGIVRPIWNDPRLHYVFNCAAISCPNLGEVALSGDTLNQQLDEASVAFVNDPRGIRIRDGKITASKIYFWYEQDFGGSEKSILKHISRYAKPKLKEAIAGKTKIHAYEYDWSLNTR